MISGDSNSLSVSNESIPHMWFHGRLSRSQADRIFEEQSEKPSGLFMVREKLDFAGNYILTVMHKAGVHHYHIKPNEVTGNYWIEGGREFHSIPALIYHFQSAKHGLVTRLRTVLSKRPGLHSNAFMGSNLTRHHLHRLVQDSLQQSSSTAELYRRPYECEQALLRKAHHNQIWYYPSLTMEQAESRLQTGLHQKGNFIIRRADRRYDKTSSPDAYHLLLLNSSAGTVERYEIEMDSNEFVRLNSSRGVGKWFGSLVQLVDFYHREANNLSTELKTIKTTSPDTTSMKAVAHNGKSIRRAHSVVSRWNLAHVPSDLQTKPSQHVNGSSCKWLDKSMLSIGSQIGQGFFGVVYMGYLKMTDGNMHPVAIKATKLNPIRPQKPQVVLNEGMIIGRLNHPNIVKLYGLSRSSKRGLLIVLEYAKGGTLLSYLRNNRWSNFSRLRKPSLMNFIYQICSGMDYLSNSNVVHRDLAARNVLLFSLSVVKITDFGLAKLVHENILYDNLNHNDLPLKWYPPESISAGIFSDKTDVWSFGITAWEILTYGDEPYQGIHPSNIRQYIEMGNRLPRPPNTNRAEYQLISSCWRHVAAERPSFGLLKTKLAPYKRLTRSRSLD